MDPPHHGLPTRYEDPRLVARGGMGEVWYAFDAQLGRPVAVKLLRGTAGGEPEATLRARFLREARAAAQLSGHRHIVAVYDAGDALDAPYMTMRWMEGGTLEEHGRTLDEDGILRALAGVARGLDGAHAAGIVHRDVKPGNIMFDGDGVPHVADFGIALVIDQAESSLTMTGAVVGTPSYMSPEQASGRPAVAASDQYALASIAFELVVGRRPFQRDGTVAELAAHVAEPVPSASLLGEGVDPAVDQVFERALAKDPADRYSTCSAFMAALTTAMRAPAAPRSSRPAMLATSIPTPARRPMGERQRAGLLGAGIITATVIGLGIVALVDPGNGGDTADPAPREATTGARGRSTGREAPAGDPGPPAEATPGAPPDAAGVRDAAIERQQRSFNLLQQGRFQEALDEGLAALPDLAGVERYEAFANFNVGASLVGLGRCDEALPYLDRSEQLQGQRREIEEARAAAQRCGRPAASKAKGKGKQQDDDKGEDNGKERDD